MHGDGETHARRCRALNRKAFHDLLGPVEDLLEHCFCMRVLERVDIFNGLSPEDLAEVADAPTVRRSVLSHATIPHPRVRRRRAALPPPGPTPHAARSYSDGDYIVRQGEAGAEFFIIREGHELRRRVAVNAFDATERRRLPVARQACFGEVACSPAEDEPLEGGLHKITPKGTPRRRRGQLGVLLVGDYFGEVRWSFASPRLDRAPLFRPPRFPPPGPSPSAHACQGAPAEGAIRASVIAATKSVVCMALDAEPSTAFSAPPEAV